MHRLEIRGRNLRKATGWALLALLTVFACSESPPSSKVPGVSLLADPNPIQICDGTRLGQTRIAWYREELAGIQLRIGAPDGRLFVRGGAHGTAETGKWVTDGMTIYLLDDSSGKLLAELTLQASVCK